MLEFTKVVLEGTPREIRNRFRTREFVAELEDCKTTSFSFDVLSQDEPVAGRMRFHFRLSEGEKPNDLATALMQAGSLMHFEEVIPGLDQIFVKVVDGTLGVENS